MTVESPFIFCASVGTNVFRSSVVSAWSWYWYCEFDWRPPARRSCAAMRKVCASRMPISFGRRRSTTADAGVLRSSRGLSATNTKPPFELPWPPVNPTTFFTAGSPFTMSIARFRAPFIFVKDASCEPWRPPMMTPVSCCGKKPFWTFPR